MKNKNKFLLIGAFCVAVAASNAAFANEEISSDFLIEKEAVNQVIVENGFDVIKKDKNSKESYVFVGGVNDTYHFWDEHIGKIKDKNVSIYGFIGKAKNGEHPHNIEYMDENAKIIALHIKKLESEGSEKINVIAHSLGGVVSKKAIHLLEEMGKLKEGVKISFTAVNSPLGGYEQANPAMYTPFFRPISKFFKIAMASDMSPHSDFYKSIEKKFENESIESKMIESLEDSIAQPSGSISKERYENIANSFNKRVVVSGDHEYARETKNLQKHGVYLVGSQNEKIQDLITTMRDTEKKKELRM